MIDFNKQLFHELLIEHGYSLTNGGSTFYFFKKIQDRKYFMYNTPLAMNLKISISKKEFLYNIMIDCSPEIFLKDNKKYYKKYKKSKYPENLFYLELSKIAYIMYKCRSPNSIKFILGD